MKSDNNDALTKNIPRPWNECCNEHMKNENQRELIADKMEKVYQEVKQIIKKESLAAIRKMKIGKAAGRDDTLVEAWKCLEYLGINSFTKMFNETLGGKKMPEE